MCHAARCRTCGKTTWAGCGRHVDAVRRSVPATQWCGGGHTQAQTASAGGGGLFGRLFGR